MPDYASPTTHFWDPAYYRPASDDFSIQAYPKGQDRPNHSTERPDNRFARQFSDQEMPSSPRVLAQLDPNLHPSTKPDAIALSVASRSRAEQMNNRSVMSIHASTEVAGQELQKLLAFSSRLQSLEDRVDTLQLCRQYTEAADSRMQASIQAQQSMLTQLCSSINRLAATTTEATKATTNLAENSSAAAAAAATAATQAQLQQAQAASGLSSRGLPGPLSRAAAECVVSNAGYVSTLLLKGAAKVAAEADVVAAILCHKVLLSEYVPPRAAAGGAAGGRRAEFLTLRNAKTAGTFLLALEAAWNLSGRSMRMLPRPLAAVASPLLRPLRVCMGYVRWTCWAALCYLLARTAQHRVAALRPAAAGRHATAAPAAAADDAPHTPASIASQPAAAAVPATAPAARCMTPKRSPAAAGATAPPSSVPGAAVLSPLATVVTGDRSQARAVLGVRAGTQPRCRGSAVAAELAAMSDAPAEACSGQASRAAAAVAAVGVGSGCSHGYTDSCPHGCDVFGEDGRVLCDENSLQEVAGAGEEDGVGIAGYVMQHGMQIADAARAWASRSRNFVRV